MHADSNFLFRIQIIPQPAIISKNIQTGILFIIIVALIMFLK